MNSINTFSRNHQRLQLQQKLQRVTVFEVEEKKRKKDSDEIDIESIIEKLLRGEKLTEEEQTYLEEHPEEFAAELEKVNTIEKSATNTSNTHLIHKEKNVEITTSIFSNVLKSTIEEKQGKKH